jgi:hypothetical protein
MKSTLIDLTSIYAVESLFRGTIKDPYAETLAGDFVDLAIYSDIVHYPLAITSAQTLESEFGPTLLKQLIARDSQLFSPKKYSTESVRSVGAVHLQDCLEQFIGWCNGNPDSVKNWIRLHRESWINSFYLERIRHKFVFDVDLLRNHHDVILASQQNGLLVDEFLRIFDVVLRYPMYGEIAGDGCAYLSHPIRHAVNHPTLQRDTDTVHVGAISFSEHFKRWAPHLSQDEYTALIYQLRGVVRDKKLHRVKPGEIEKEVIRDIAASVSLPPKLAFMMKSETGSSPALGVLDFITGVPMSIAQTFWDGTLPKSAGRLKWLRWALKWDIESQAKK